MKKLIILTIILASCGQTAEQDNIYKQIDSNRIAEQKALHRLELIEDMMKHGFSKDEATAKVDTILKRHENTY